MSEELTVCEEYGDHRDYECVDEDSRQYWCNTCGAEWWEGEETS